MYIRPETMMMNIFEREGWYENRVVELEQELALYKQALTKSVSLPQGALPNSKQYYTWVNCGNVVVEKRK